MNDRPILVLGSTGYVGGRLVPLLLDKGYTVRAAGRSIDKIKGRSWGNHARLQVVQADMHDSASLKKAAEGCRAAFYLVHSMSNPGRDFAETERDAAYSMVDAANHASLERIIYLGGLGEDKEDVPLSKHLRSRAEVGRILQLGAAQVTTLRAAQIIGAGSSSFELIRYLVDRLPVMLCPKWVRTKTQPIAIQNVIEYLAGCLENPDTAGLTMDIGGPDVLSYAELFRFYAKVAGIGRRAIIPTPFLSPRLSSFWVTLITPIPIALTRALIEGLRNEVICTSNTIHELVPITLISAELAIQRALSRTEKELVDTCYFDVGNACLPEWASEDDPHYAGGAFYEFGYKARLQGDPKGVWKVVERIGGERGWYYGDLLWRIRGFIDRLLTGPGLRRGRPHSQETARVGDALDFWRILAVTPGERLLLKAEMRLPGEALLEFKIQTQWEKAVDLSMVAKFKPTGLRGILYWYAFYPFHIVLFKNMIQNISREAGTHIYSPPKRIDKEKK
ncbi:MAG: SDR family oxidoreductase [Pseudodesulfovibrio sp.]|nr:SDR family oxidoreductase [Pseudodesulfovibrio sp.]